MVKVSRGEMRCAGLMAREMNANRSSAISKASSEESGLIIAPLNGLIMTVPSFSSARSASRIGDRLTSNFSTNSASVRRSPGLKTEFAHRQLPLPAIGRDIPHSLLTGRRVFLFGSFENRSRAEDLRRTPRSRTAGRGIALHSSTGTTSAGRLSERARTPHTSPETNHRYKRFLGHVGHPAEPEADAAGLLQDPAQLQRIPSPGSPSAKGPAAPWAAGLRQDSNRKNPQCKS
jgi:hypothetical protein